MKRALVLSFAVFMISTPVRAQNTYQNEIVSPDEMRRCQSFGECAMVWGGCSDVAINKKYVDRFKQSAACLQSTAHNPQAMPTCTEGFCVVVTPDEKK